MANVYKISIFALYAWLIFWGAAMDSAEHIPTSSIEALNAQCYNARADDWDRLPFAAYLPNQVLAMHHPAAGKRALDIGSGTGMLADWFAKQGFEILCLDPAQEMVLRCRAKGLNTLQTSLQNFSCNEKFGLIVAVLSLIHIPKREIPEQFKRITEWLNPNGTLVLAVIEGQGEGIGEKNSRFPRYFSYFTRQEIFDLTQKNYDCVFEKRVSGPITYLVFIFRKKQTN